MRVQDVRPGMKGYGLSTFEGAHIERFEVEVLGTSRSWLPQGIVVLVRMSGRVVDKAGTIAGMSGSPVYIDGKLLGAIAYGFPYCTIPLAGVTPIEEMLAARQIEDKGGAAGSAAQRAAYGRALRRDMADLLAATRQGRTPQDARVEAAARKMVIPLCLRRRPAELPAVPQQGSVHGLCPCGQVGVKDDHNGHLHEAFREYLVFNANRRQVVVSHCRCLPCSGRCVATKSGRGGASWGSGP